MHSWHTIPCETGADPRERRVPGGRVAHQELHGLGLAEVDEVEWQQCWLPGGHHRSLLAPDEEAGLP